MPQPAGERLAGISDLPERTVPRGLSASRWQAGEQHQVERVWPRLAVARVGSDDHVGEDARPAPVEENVKVPGRVENTFFPIQVPSSAMVFAPGAQPGRGVRSSSAVRSSIG